MAKKLEDYNFDINDDTNLATLSSEEIENYLSNKYNSRCAYCDTEVIWHGKPKASREHVLPLSKGGGNTFANVILACGSCNSSKGGKTPEEWRKTIIYARRFNGIYFQENKDQYWYERYGNNPIYDWDGNCLDRSKRITLRK